VGRAGKRRKRPFSKSFWWILVSGLIIFSVAVRWWHLREGVPAREFEFQIEVLNGSGREGIAMKTAMQLRRAGVDVLVVGDAERFDFDESILVDRKGNAELMVRLSRITGCRNIIEQRQEQPLVDATLIVGRDRGRLKIGN
jgi:hypothetical protein